MDKHLNDDHGQIPESSQFIPDSTLIPQSEQIYPESDDKGDAHVAYDDGGLPGGRGNGVETFATKKPSFMMKNLPLIAVLVVGTGIGGSFLYKKVLHPSNPTQAVQAVPQAAEPAPGAQNPAPAAVESQPTTASIQQATETSKTEAAALPAPTVQPQQPAIPAPVQPVANAQPEPVKPTVAAVEPPAPVAPKTEAAFAAPVPAKQQPVAPVVPVVDTRSAKELELERRKSEALQSELAEMRARMATLESALSANRVQPAPVVNAKPAPAVAVSATSYAPHAPAHAAHPAKHKVRSHVQPKKVALEQVEGYSVTAVRNSLAWVNTPAGVVTVREGDTLPGVGRVTGISESAMRVSVGNKFVK